MGRWLASLRKAEKIRADARGGTDRTDTTPANEVSSVSSVSPGAITENFRSGRIRGGSGSVSFVSGHCEADENFQHGHAWDMEDWRAAFDERAGILEFDEGLSREDAERVAGAEIAERRRVLH
ncbi:hypothetical protein RUR49_12385 [Pseudoxanthobacter sp. M-2]|uniref:hypothetical protein n=1 Tax=Pseudoxanthobacter sp. M-2 TaxID=3078754 RepID=UPI0038FC1890